MINPFFENYPPEMKKEMIERCDRIRALPKYQVKKVELKKQNKQFIEWSQK